MLGAAMTPPAIFAVPWRAWVDHQMGAVVSTTTGRVVCFVGFDAGGEQDMATAKYLCELHNKRGGPGRTRR